MKMRQTALILMFFMCLSMLFTGCGTLFLSKAKDVKIRTLPQESSEQDEEDKDIQRLKQENEKLEKENKDLKKQLEGQTPTPVKSEPTRYINLTQNIVNDINGAGLAFKGFNYYLSKPFSITVTERNDAPKKFESNEGRLIVSREQIPIRRFDFSTTDIGKLRTDSSPESLIIDFKEIPLRFKRNSQGYFECVSAEIESRVRNLQSEDGLPQLLIIAEINDHLEVRTSNSDTGRSLDNVNTGSRSYGTFNAGISGGRQSRNIADAGTLTPSKIIAFVRSKNRSVDPKTLKTLEELIGAYILEAKTEGINYDIAIAQMLYATNYLRNRMTTRNYAGFSSTPGWSGSFSDMNTGVRAHIQHLKGYASSQALNRKLVDPRYKVLEEKRYLGKAQTLDELSGYWTANPASYANSINGILDGLYSSIDY